MRKLHKEVLTKDQAKLLPLLEKWLDNIIAMTSLLTLAAMKAYVLGRRAKWKDYVDLYFIMKHFYKIDEVAKKEEKFSH